MLYSQALTSHDAPFPKRRHVQGGLALSSGRLLRPAAALKLPGCSPGLRGVSMKLLESTSDAVEPDQLNTVNSSPRDQEEDDVADEEEASLPRTQINNDEEKEEAGISRIPVPRQRYIAVSKTELRDAIVSKLFGSETDEDARHFLLLCECLDSILHAEHKSILEEMRTDYFSSHSMKDGELREKSLNSSEREVDDDGKTDESNTINGYGDEIPENWLGRFNYGIDLSNLPSLIKTGNSNGKSRLAVDTRFQRAFMQLLNAAQFEELSATDLMLTSALNTDYLLTLPIYVDWKKASESNAIIFRRGYTAERQKGLLIVEKLDYLQSKLLRGTFSIASKPLGRIGNWISKALIHASETEEGKFWIIRLKQWLKELSLFQQSQISDNLAGADELSVSDLPMWLAAQRAVSRYEGSLSETGPRGRLLRKLLSWIGLIPRTSEASFHMDADNNSSEPYLRTSFLSRVSLSDIWRPATRKYCGNDIWKILKTSISILLSKTTLQEPAFKELILLYTEDVSERDVSHNSGVQPLQLKIYQKIPIPDLPVIFPHKKLSFRIIDTVRLDVASILGLLAFLINYKFEDISSSPSAILLDVVAVSALIIYVTRVALGYKQTWDRYQLLVNKTLYEKTLASGFGSVHFLLDASEQQQYKEAILTYAVLLKVENGQAISQKQVGEGCERFMHNVFKEKVEMSVDKAVNTLVRLGLVTEMPATDEHGTRVLRAIPCSRAYEALKNRWNSLLA